MKNIVVVESPSKAKTIGKYLGKDFTILASYGHVRDLPSKSGSVRPDDHFAMDWEIDPSSKKQVADIAKALKGAERLYLATDPDREGEAISWHIKEILDEKKALKNIAVDRVAFNAITKEAVTKAINNPRDIDQNLVDAYLARRGLDYLVGFTLSPVLWRKLPGSKSAGRVQSVALRIVVDREEEIEAFKPQEYWSVEGVFISEKKADFSAKLSHFDGKKLTKLSIGSKDEADHILGTLKGANYRVTSVEKKRVQRHPKPPFTTSTLQQEASRKLGFSPKKTMILAQRLYEGIDMGGETTGLITYMRTDSIQVDGSALTASRAVIEKEYGQKYLPSSPRAYKSKAKNTQEAHEAIRPTDLSRLPKSVKSYLDGDQLKLYTLIWNRMVASQMASAEIDQVGVNISADNDAAIFRATGSTIFFDGFLTLYMEGTDEGQEQDDDSKLLPPLAEGEGVDAKDIIPSQHFTQPPPRYTEASLIKKMEEIGIGRPSTYTQTINTLTERGYVRLEKRQLRPEERGRFVTKFLTLYFPQYVEDDFTAELETELDEISSGERQWRDVLQEFWGPFHQKTDEVQALQFQDVLENLQQALDSYVFPAREDGKDPHECPECKDGKLALKLGKFGAFIGCSNYPECKHTSKNIGGNVDVDTDADVPQIEIFEERDLGLDPERDLHVFVKKGPYGFYMQWGETPKAEKGKKKPAKPKRVSVPKGVSPMDVTLEQALSLGALPREVGINPNTGEMITADNGRYGPYVKHGKDFISLKKDDNVMTVTLERALELIEEHANKPKRPRRKAK